MRSIHHPLLAEDRPAMARLRAAALPAKGILQRAAFDAVMEQTAPAPGVTYQAGTVGGVSGWWCRPTAAQEGSAILYLHGGGFIVGSASAYRNLVGQIAARANSVAFVADYGLAPAFPFPRAVNDAAAAYRGLVALGYTHIALAGDSSGGGLALGLLGQACEEARNGSAVPPTGAVVLSPWTDLALTGATLETRADADPFLTRAVLASGASQYLGATSPREPLASPLYGKLSRLPPVLLHVGEDEILLEDSIRYAERFAAAGGDVTLNIWEGMPHVFLSNVGVLSAATAALDDVGEFLRDLAREEPTSAEVQPRPVAPRASAQGAPS